MICGSKYGGVEEKYINDFSDAMFLRDTLMSCNIKYAGQMIGSFESVTEDTLKFLIRNKVKSGGSYRDIGEYVYNSIMNVFLDSNVKDLPISSGVDGVLMLCTMFEEVLYDLYVDCCNSNDPNRIAYLNAVGYIFKDISCMGMDGFIVASLVNYAFSSVIIPIYPNIYQKSTKEEFITKLKCLCDSYSPTDKVMNCSVFDVDAFVKFFRDVQSFDYGLM